MLVPESVCQTHSVAHQKDSHEDRQLSGQNQDRHLSLLLEEETDLLTSVWRGVKEFSQDKRLDWFGALIVAQTYIYLKTLGGKHFGIQRWPTGHF